jgi:hypothetical protein
MASILKVNTIQDATNSNTAMTIDSSGRVLTAVRPAFRVHTNNSSHFGQDHGDTTYDTNYLTPIPTFPDANTTTELNVGGGTLTFETHPAGNGGKYLKYVVPVTGVYVFGMQGAFTLKTANDYASTGFMVNSAAEAGSGNFPTQVINGYQAYAVDAVMPISGQALFNLTAGDYVVPYAVSIHEAHIDNSIGIRIHGYLLG